MRRAPRHLHGHFQIFFTFDVGGVIIDLKIIRILSVVSLILKGNLAKFCTLCATLSTRHLLFFLIRILSMNGSNLFTPEESQQT